MKVYLVINGSEGCEGVLHVFKNEKDAQEYCEVYEKPNMHYRVQEMRVQEGSLFK